MTTAATSPPYPITAISEAQILLSRRCLWSCAYCDFGLSRTGLPPSPRQFRAYLREAQFAGATQVTLQAGDGLEHLPEIASAVRYFGFAAYEEYLSALCQLAWRQGGKRALFPVLEVGPLRLAQLHKLQSSRPVLRLMLDATPPNTTGTDAPPAPSKVLEARAIDLEQILYASYPAITGTIVGAAGAEASIMASAQMAADLQKRYGHIMAYVLRVLEPAPHAPVAMASCSSESIVAAINAASEGLRGTIPISVEVGGRTDLLPSILDAGVTDLGSLRVASFGSEQDHFPHRWEQVRGIVEDRGQQFSARTPYAAAWLQAGGRPGQAASEQLKRWQARFLESIAGNSHAA